MKGFFSNIHKVTKQVAPVRKVVRSCADCPLREQSCSKESVTLYGEGSKVLILTGTMNVSSRNLERLESELERVDIDFHKDCCWTSVIQSTSPHHQVLQKNGKSKDVTDSHLYLECCRPKIHNFIKELHPIAILALGDRALTSLVADRTDFRGSFGTIDNWEGYCIPDQKFGSWIIPTWSIPRLLEAENGKEKNGPVYTRHFRKSIKMLANAVSLGHPEIRYDSRFTEVIIDDNKAIDRMEECKAYAKSYPNHVVSFDYETTGIKPYLPKQRIVCVALAWREDYSCSFELNEKTWPVFESILFDKSIKKCAHNIAFENLWTHVKSPSQQEVVGWKQDTMLDAHILDNRTGNTGLKKQTYFRFGVAGYDDEVDEYLKADHANDMNRVTELPIGTVLKYCAYDALYGLWLAQEQDKEFAHLARKHPKILEARKLFLDGAITLSEMGRVGFRIDKKVLKANKLEIQKSIAELTEKIMQDPNVQAWKRRMGSSFNLNSNDQLSETLFKYMGLPEPDKKTDSGKIATDAKTLADYDVDFLKYKAEIKKLEKLMGTYVDGIDNEAPDGILHCFFTLNGPRTFRSSSNSANLQNIPKRWPYAKNLIRRSMFPTIHGCLFEADYSSLEVGISAAYNKDKNMLKYLAGHGDMHKDAALDIFLLRDHPELMTKPLRQGGKNGFVFPEFYGDYFKNCAVALWKDYVLKEKLADGTPVLKWMAKHKIRTLEDFTQHMHEVECILWEERFAEYNQWRKDFFHEYVRTGEYWNYTGFPYRGIMNKKDSSNYAVQGSAFHVNLYAMNQLHKEIKRNGMKSRLCGEIHDAVDGIISPDEFNDFIPLLQTIMVDRCHAKFDWIITPLSIEIDVAPCNHSWGEMDTIFERPEPCKCGAKYGYKKKLENPSRIRWECPMCEHFEYEEL